MQVPSFQHLLAVEGNALGNGRRAGMRHASGYLTSDPPSPSHGVAVFCSDKQICILNRSKPIAADGQTSHQSQQFEVDRVHPQNAG